MKPTLTATVTGTRLEGDSVDVTLDVSDVEGEVYSFTVRIPPEYKPPSAGDVLELVVPCSKRRGK